MRKHALFLFIVILFAAALARATRSLAGLTLFTMSDMLQLVVRLTDSQVIIIRVTPDIELASLDDKLKHVGHWLSLFLELLGNVPVQDSAGAYEKNNL